MDKVFDKIRMKPLITLRDYFKTLPENYGRFRMTRYAQDKSGNILLPHDIPECGTSMCLVGHLPLLGYPGLKYEEWSEYCHRILNIDVSHSGDDTIWNYLFAGFWRSDVQLAITRLDDVINKRKSSIKEESNLIVMINDYDSLFN